MSVTTERLGTPKIRTVETRTPRRGGWAILAIAMMLAVAAAILLVWPSQRVTESAGSTGRVEIAAEQAGQIWTLKAAQAPSFASQGSPAGVESSTPTGEALRVPSTTSAMAADWAAKAAYGRARQAAFGDTQR
jgi:hypothetical protein